MTQAEVDKRIESYLQENDQKCQKNATIAAFLDILVIFYIPGLSLNALYILLFLLGVFCGSHPLCFSLGKENNPKHLVGSALAVTNTIIMSGGVVFQPLVGKLLDYHASGAVINGVPVYTASDFQFSLIVLPIAMIASIVILLFINETYCRTPDVKILP